MSKYLKTENGIVTNVEMISNPQNAGNVVYYPAVSGIGKGYERKSDHWYRSWGEGDYVKIGFDGNVIERVSPLDSA